MRVEKSDVKIFALLFLLSALPASSQPSPEVFARNCAGCHGESARGTAKAPGLAMNSRVAEQSVDQLSTFLERGNIAAGMPSFADLPAADRRALAHYLLDLNVGMVIRPVVVAEAARKVTWGSPRPGDWLSYNGNDSANRFSPLKAGLGETRQLAQSIWTGYRYWQDLPH